MKWFNWLSVATGFSAGAFDVWRLASGLTGSTMWLTLFAGVVCFASVASQLVFARLILRRQLLIAVQHRLLRSSSFYLDDASMSQRSRRP